MSWTTALCLEENQRLWLLTPQEAGAFRYDLCWICWFFLESKKIFLYWKYTFFRCIQSQMMTLTGRMEKPARNCSRKCPEKEEEEERRRMLDKMVVNDE